MPGTGTAELAALLDELAAAHRTASLLGPPSPDEAMAIYAAAVRLVELQPADSGDATARELLIAVRRLLSAALDGVTDGGAD